MQKKSKSEIKKLIADLHAKPKDGQSKTHQAEQAAGSGKASKGAGTNKTYRPKI